MVAKLEPISERQASAELAHVSQSSQEATGSIAQPREQERATHRAVDSNGQQLAEGSEVEARDYDLIIFAASGSVGQFLVEELALVLGKQGQKFVSYAIIRADPQPDSSADCAPKRRQSVPSSSKPQTAIRWAVAGRSAVRLSECLCRAELSTGTRALSQQVPVVLADLEHQNSLLAMCRQTRLVINCAGPYSELGAERMIEAALEARTHYLDLAHEVAFMELIRRRYARRALQAGVFLIQGCGFQSMSSELGLNFLKQVGPQGQVDEVKIVLSLSELSAGLVTRAMWNSLLADQEFSETLSGERKQKEEKQRQQQQQAVAQADELGELKQRRLLKRKDTQLLVRELVQFRNQVASSNSGWWWWCFWFPLRLMQDTTFKLLYWLLPAGRRPPIENELAAAQASPSWTSGGYAWPIDCLTSDESQLIRCEMGNYELRANELDAQPSGWRLIKCNTLLALSSFGQLCAFSLWLSLFQVALKWWPTRRLMRAWPRLATCNQVVPLSWSEPKERPGNRLLECGEESQAAAAASSSWPICADLFSGSRPERRLDRASLSAIKFSQTFVAYGTPGANSGDPLERRERHSLPKRQQLLVSRLVGPEPNHVATATFAIQAALTLLAERDHLPVAGGALTPGVAFAETNIIHQLKRRNIKFEVLKKA